MIPIKKVYHRIHRILCPNFMQTLSTHQVLRTIYNTPTNSQPANIVVIDDHSLVRTIIVDLMSLEGYRVTEFDSSVNLIQEITKIQPDVILLDIILPEMEGFEICQKLRQNASTQFIPIIFFSTLLEQKLRVKGQAIGGNDFLDKPLNHLELSNKVRYWIDQKNKPLNKGLI